MLTQIASSAITLLLFFVLLFGYTKLAGPLPFSVNSVSTTKSTTFDVTGEGKVSVKPDSARVSAGVTANGPSVVQVQDQMNSIINKVTAAIKAQGIESTDLQTSTYNVNPRYDYSAGTQKINGYEARTSLTINVKDINKLNAVIDAATGAGATNVSNLGFQNADNQQALDQARKLAVEDAKKKAQNIAGIAGFQLGKIVNYSEGGQGQPRPMMIGALDAKASTGAPTQIEPGSNETTVTVTLSYEIH